MKEKRLDQRQQAVLQALQTLYGKSTSKEIGKKVGLSSNSTAQILCFLERQGFVRRYVQHRGLGRAYTWILV